MRLRCRNLKLKADSSLIATRRFFYIRNPDYVGRATNTIPSGNKSSHTLSGFSNLPTPLSKVACFKQILKDYKMSNLTIFNFENTPVQTIVENNEIFFRATQLAELLQYKNPHDALRKHVDSDDLAKREIVNTINKRAQVLFVNESGMYSLVLSSKLEQAKKVKRWVTSEVLPAIRKTGKYQLQPKQLALPEPEKKFTFEFTEYELQQLAWLWFAFKRGIGTFQHIEKAFNVLGSNMSGQIYGQAYEYLSVLRSTNQILNRITSDFNIDPMTNWRVLKHLRGFNPKAVKIDF